MKQSSSRPWFLNGLAEVSSGDRSRLEFQLTRLITGAVPKFPAQCKDFTAGSEFWPRRSEILTELKTCGKIGTQLGLDPACRSANSQGFMPKESFTCVMCGTQFGPTDQEPDECPICNDDRQHVPAGPRQEFPLKVSASYTDPCFLQGSRFIF